MRIRELFELGEAYLILGIAVVFCIHDCCSVQKIHLEETRKNRPENMGVQWNIALLFGCRAWSDFTGQRGIWWKWENTTAFLFLQRCMGQFFENGMEKHYFKYLYVCSVRASSPDLCTKIP